MLATTGRKYGRVDFLLAGRYTLPEQNLKLINASIPADFWAELKREGLLRADAPTPL